MKNPFGKKEVPQRLPELELFENNNLDIEF
jgi:hypothetical protein